jgi:hypothetical protein
VLSVSPVPGRWTQGVRHIVSCLSSAGQCGTQQSKKAFNADEEQMHAEHADGPESGMPFHGKTPPDRA